MAIKHIAHKETLDRGYASEWNDDHVEDFNTRIGCYQVLRSFVLVACWDIYSAGTGVDPVVTLVGAAGSGHAFVVFNTGATTNNTSGMRKELAGAVGNITSPLDLPIMTWTMQIDTVHTVGTVIEMGLLDSGTVPFTANQDGAYFRVHDNKLYAVTGTGAAETTTDLGAFNEYGQYRIEVLSASVRFYVDDMQNAVAVHTTHRPDSDLTLMFTIRSLNNVDSTMRMDGVDCNILRKQ